MYHLSFLSFLSLDKYGDIYIIILGRLRKKIKKILDKIKKMGIIKVEKNKRREVKMQVKIRYGEKVKEIIREVRSDGTVDIGIGIVPVKEVKKWFDFLGLEFIEISNIEGRQ